jgi:hypothetical protein
MKSIIQTHFSLYPYFVITGILLLVSSLIIPHQIIKAQNVTSSNHTLAQIVQSLKKVNGRYVNPSAGLQVDLPKGWKGMEFPFVKGFTPGGGTSSVWIVPPGVGLLSKSGMDFGGRGFGGPFLGLPPISIAFTNLNDTQAMANRVMVTHLFDASYAAAAAAGCKISSPLPVKINGIDAVQHDTVCATRGKATWYLFATPTKVIDIIVSDPTTAMYDTHLPQFQAFLNTLNIADAVNPTTVPALDKAHNNTATIELNIGNNNSMNRR